MIKGGTGGGNTQVGLKFESRVDIRKVFENIPNYEVKEDIIYFNNKKVAQLFQKHKLYKNLLEKKNVDYSTIISKKLLPDDSVLVFDNNTLYIIEIKFQETPGSVDEKLQTCDFKFHQYKKLLASLGIKVKYVYILNDWFKKPEYADVLEYIHKVECYYFFEELPFDFLGLPKPDSQ